MHSSTSPDGFIALFHNQNSKFGAVAVGAIAIAVLIADQLSKGFVIAHVFFDAQCLPWCGHKEIVPGWLRIAPEPNYHGAFGLLGSNTFLLIAMALIVLVKGGGAWSVDRAHYGYVIDFIDFYRFPNIWRFTFNVADSCITIGVILLLLSSVTSRRHA